MTDARLKGEWLTAAAHDGLSDAAYRVLHNALMHSAEQGTDGEIADRELRFLYPGVLDPSVLTELEDAGFWERTSQGYTLIGWDTALGQSTAAEVAEYRRKNRERQQRRRARQATSTPHAGEAPPFGGDAAWSGEEAPNSEVVTRDVTGSVTRDVPGVVGKARTGSASASPIRARRASSRAPANLPTSPRRHDCALDGHALIADGTSCARCEYRDRDRIEQLLTVGRPA